MTRPFRRDSERGLTVLEVLLASTLLLMFLGALFGLVWSTATFRDRLERQVRTFEVGPPVLDIVAADLAHALTHSFKESDSFEAVEESVGGTDTTELDFATVVTSRSRVEIDNDYLTSAVCEVGYRMRRSERYDGLFALYRREDFGVDDEPFEGGKFYKLADRVVEFRIDFFEEDPGDPEGDEALGVMDWDAKEKKGLPYAARITLVIQPPVETDDRGDAIEDVQDITFIRYVAFAGRHDDAGQ